MSIWIKICNLELLKIMNHCNVSFKNYSKTSCNCWFLKIYGKNYNYDYFSMNVATLIKYSGMPDLIF